jgi:hypothetical protein
MREEILRRSNSSRRQEAGSGRCEECYYVLPFAFTLGAYERQIMTLQHLGEAPWQMTHGAVIQMRASMIITKPTGKHFWPRGGKEVVSVIV